MVEVPGRHMPHKGEVKRRGEPPIGGGIKAVFATRLGGSTGSGTDAAGPTTWRTRRRDRCGGSRLFLCIGSFHVVAVAQPATEAARPAPPPPALRRSRAELVPLGRARPPRGRALLPPLVYICDE